MSSGRCSRSAETNGFLRGGRAGAPGGFPVRDFGPSCNSLVSVSSEREMAVLCAFFSLYSIFSFCSITNCVLCLCIQSPQERGWSRLPGWSGRCAEKVLGRRRCECGDNGCHGIETSQCWGKLPALRWWGSDNASRIAKGLPGIVLGAVLCFGCSQSPGLTVKLSALHCSLEFFCKSWIEKHPGNNFESGGAFVF